MNLSRPHLQLRSGHPRSLDAPGLYTAAVWFDFDQNGTQDLFVGHFVKYNKALERACGYNGVPHYCYPLSYDPFPSRLYRNNGNGTFTDVSDSSGIGKCPGKVFGALATDVNNDGLLDLFVANDSVANFLFLNKGNGSFDEIGMDAGVAYSSDGAARSGMGVDSSDYNHDGWQDLFVSNFTRERFSTYRNRGNLTFEDEAGASGVGTATQMYSGWGVKFFDFDLDGDQDLIVCNGHPDDLIEKISSTLTYLEPLLLFHNEGRSFVNMGAAAGDAFTHNYPARGLAIGDLNNDGFPDVVIANNGAAPLVLQHNGSPNHWVGLQLKSPLAIGVMLSWSAGGRKRSRLKTSGGSYLSASDPRELIGIGSADRLDWLEVRWPKPLARIDRFENVQAGRYYALKPGGPTGMIGLVTVLLASSAVVENYQRANALFQQQQFAEAGKALDEALAENPDFVPALTLRGKFAMAFNRFDVARESFKHAARVAPDSAYAQFMLGFFYYVDNDFARAVPPLESAIHLSPNDAQACFYLAMSEEGLARSDVALSFYEKTVALEAGLNQKSNPDVHTAYGRLLFTLGRYEDSARQVARVLELDPKSRDGHYEQGRLLLQKDQFAAAAAEGEKALESPGLGTTDRQIHFLLARAYSKAGQKQLAEQHRKQFEASPPTLRR